MENQPRRVIVQDILDYHAELDQYARDGASKAGAAIPQRSVTETIYDLDPLIKAELSKTAIGQMIAQDHLAEWLIRQKQLPSADQLERGILPDVYYNPPKYPQIDWQLSPQQQRQQGRTHLGALGNSLGTLGDILGGIFK